MFPAPDSRLWIPLSAIIIFPCRQKKAGAGSDQERWVGKAADQPKEEVKAELPEEMTITQEMRQEGYDRKTTTDDHGMHIYGMAQDQNGTKYFIVKNSWGETGKYKGVWYASDAFVRYKTLNIVVPLGICKNPSVHINVGNCIKIS